METKKFYPALWWGMAGFFGGLLAAKLDPASAGYMSTTKNLVVVGLLFLAGLIGIFREDCS